MRMESEARPQPSIIDLAIVPRIDGQRLDGEADLVRGEAGGGEAGGGNATSGQVPAMFERDVGTALPVLPGWVEAPGEQGGDAA